MFFNNHIFIYVFIYAFRYLDPIFFGNYPISMRKNLGSNLPSFTSKEAALIKGSQDFVGINHCSSMYATHNDTNGNVIQTGILKIYFPLKLFLIFPL